MGVTIKRMETDGEIRGKAFVHWRAWHEAYADMVSREYLDNLTLDKCEKMAFSWPENTFVAKDGDSVIGFVSWGSRGEEPERTGEIFALYVLKEWYGTGIGRRLMECGLEQLKEYPAVFLWVLKDNGRAIRFYEKCGFRPEGTENYLAGISAAEIQMIWER